MRRALASLLLTACQAAPLPGPTAPSLSRDVQPIFKGHCAGIECHAAQFAVGKSWRNLVGVPSTECTEGRPLVAPGDPDGSYLVDKIRGRNLCEGVRMPKIGAVLSDEEIGTISDWIGAGALDD
jgi:hypothetical protein